MNIVLIGATGFVGSAVLNELLARGHQVTAVARQASKLSGREGLRPVAADVMNAGEVSRVVAAHDAVVNAFNPGWDHPDLYATFMKGSRAITEGVRQAGVKRLLVVGGAGSLFVAPGVQLVDTPAFTDHVPANVLPGARAARDVLTELRTETELEWTFLSPPAMLAPGQRTGAYRLGGEELLMNGAQPAGISVADLAVALVDELEQPRHLRQRFTVAN